MGYMDIPGGIDQSWAKTYSIVLKLQGLIFATIFPVGYFVKFGVAWHDAGQPFNAFDVARANRFERGPRRFAYHLKAHFTLSRLRR